VDELTPKLEVSFSISHLLTITISGEGACVDGGASRHMTFNRVQA